MNELTATLYALETRLLESSVRNRTELVEALLADDFVEIGSSGRVWLKAAIVASLRDEPPIERRLSEFQAALLSPDVALVTYHIERLETPDATPVKSLRSSVWVRAGGQWRMRFHQGTLTT